MRVDSTLFNQRTILRELHDLLYATLTYFSKLHEHCCANVYREYFTKETTQKNYVMFTDCLKWQKDPCFDVRISYDYMLV